MDSPLVSALPGAQFTEHHVRVIATGQERVWRALHEVTWDDLTVSGMLLRLRFASRSPFSGKRLVEPPGPGVPIEEEAPRWLTSGMIGRPWNPRPTPGPRVRSLAELSAFDEPGWLKYGMQWQLTALPGGRTRVTTTTVCEATDRSAYRRFRRYWTAIRLFSGLVRLDMLHALDRLTRTT